MTFLGRVVVDHVQNDLETRFVDGGNHLLELAERLLALVRDSMQQRTNLRDGENHEDPIRL